MAYSNSSTPQLSWDEVDVTAWLNGTAEDHLTALGALNEQYEASANQEGISTSGPPPTTATKPRRLACLACRHRKVRCSGGRGSCQRCTRLGHECVYDKDMNAAPHPKFQSFEEMKARLDQLEKRFGQQDSRNSPAATRPAGNEEAVVQVTHTEKSNELPDPSLTFNSFPSTATSIASLYGLRVGPSNYFPAPRWEHDATRDQRSPEFTNLGLMTPSISSDHSNPFPTLTPQVEDVAFKNKVSYAAEPANSTPLSTLLQDGWHSFQQKYFELIHPSIPILDENHFFTSIAKEPASPHSELAALCLAVHMYGAIAVDHQSKLHMYYYQCARQLLERLETDGCKIGIATVQAWTLIAFYEFRQLLFSKAWMSSGRASRLAQMMGLHRLDSDWSQTVDTSSTLIHSGECNQSRQTFAFVFILDRFTSISTGLPTTLVEKQITTKLPSPNGSYSYRMIFSALSTSQSTKEIPEFPLLSPLGKMIFIAEICARICEHGNTPLNQVSSSYITSHEYWFDHHRYDQLLSSLAQALSFEGLPFQNNPISQFITISIHPAAIYLQKGAIDHGKKIASMEALVEESKKKCLQAALKIAYFVQMMPITKTTPIHPFFPWSLYCATKVTSYFLSKDSNDSRLLETQNVLVAVLTTIGGRVDKLDDPQSAPFTGVTQLAC